MDNFKLDGRAAIVTGSSRGIGRAIAEALAGAGARVAISSRAQKDCDVVAAGINSRHGAGRAIAVAADILAKDSLQKLVNTTRSAFGKVDILVCNAVTSPYVGPMLEIDDESFRKHFEGNVLSHNQLIQMTAPDMIAQRDGSIIVISSISALAGTPTIGAYALCKAADIQLVRNFAVELGPHNIRVNAITPGPTRTEFAKPIWEDQAVAQMFASMTVLGRIAEPAEIAGAAVFLASPASSFLTGQSIVIDGGLTIRGAG